MSDFSYYNLSGGADYVTSKLLLAQSSKNLCWQDSKNIEIYKNNGISRMKGNTLLAQVPSNSAITGLFEYRKGDNTYLIVNSNEGNFYKYDGVEFVLKKSGLTSGTKYSYVNFLNGVVCANGVDDPFFFEDGASEEIKPCNAVSGTTNIRGRAMAVYKGRLWFGSEGVLYHSALGRFDDWETAEDAGYIANFHNDSGKIVALGLYKGYLAIYKEDQTYLLSGDNPENFAITPFADKGACSPHGLASIENRQYFYDNGVFCLEELGQLNQISLSAEVSKKIHSLFENFDYSRKENLIALAYPQKRQLWFYFPFNDDNYLKTAWIYSYEHNAWFKRQVPQEITFACLYDGKIMTGTSEGKILVEDSGDTFEEEVIPFFWASPFFAFNRPDVNKTVDGLLLSVDNACDNKFRLFARKDFALSENEDEMLFEVQDATSLQWEVDFWGDDAVGAIWAMEIEVTDRAFISGSNKAFQLCIEGSESSHNCALLGFMFQDVLLDE